MRFWNKAHTHARGGRSALVALAIAAGTLGVSACGSDDDESSDGDAAEGGEITISHTSQPDFLIRPSPTPVNAIEPLWVVYTPLLTYRPRGGSGRTPS